MQKITKKIPMDARKEITFLLHNYKNIDKVIEEDKNKYINSINVSANAWRKGITSYNNTLENQVINIINSQTIHRLNKWKIVLKDFFIRFKDDISDIEREYINLRYFKRKNLDEISQKLNISKQEQRGITENVISLIYCYAVEQNLYQIREEAS